MASKAIGCKPFASAFDKAKKRKLGDAARKESEVNDESNKPKKKKQRPPKKRKGTKFDQSSSKKRPLSREALDLSAQLKECSKNKNLAEALSLFWGSRNAIRDQFHASITIDCCARCGALEDITRILESLKEPASVETNTGAIKGYSHGGDIRKASQLFESMFQRQVKLQPNVRTLNTLLRGCLWTAATLDNRDQICGGVVTSEKAWSAYEKEKTTRSEENTSPPSYEYTISLLCQALRTDEAEERIEQFQKLCGVTIGKQIKGGDQSSLETLAISHSALARAHALRGNKVKAIDACNLARRIIKASAQRQGGQGTTDSKTTGRRCAVGGAKSGWKDNDDRRAASNAIFRDHRISELELSLDSLVEVCQSNKFPPEKDLLATRMVNGLFYFSGGGTTQLSSESDEKDKAAPNKSYARQLRRQVANSSWLSFGLRAAVIQSGMEVKLPSDFLRVKDSERIFRAVGKNPKAIQDDGYIDFDSIFPKGANDIDIELGSGYGEWIVNQASSMPERNHVAVELRADRVHQMFAKGILHPSGPLPNLAVVGDDGSSFLQDRVKPKCISNIFANHPEPPTQVQGKSDRDLKTIMDGDAEPSHMLSSGTLVAAGRALQNKGRIVIVTDNMNYARLLCATVVRIYRQRSSSLQSSRLKPKEFGMREVESFLLNESKPDDGRVVLMEGQPSSKMGHAISNASSGKGSSYFDRLWRTGACEHASTKERYVLVLEQQD